MLELVAKKLFFRPGPTSRPRLFAIGLLLVVLSSLGLTGATYATERIGDLEHYIHRLVNDHRGSLGLKPLAFSPEIAEIARRHSQNMAAGRVEYGHGGIESRRHAVRSFIRQKGNAENVHTIRNHPSPAVIGQEAVADWLDSPGHRRHIEGDYHLTGIGVARAADGRYYLTQFFVRTGGAHPKASAHAAAATHSSPVPLPTPEPTHSTEAQPPPAEVDAAPSLFAQLAWALLGLAWDLWGFAVDLYDLAWDLLLGLAWALFAPVPAEPPAPAIAVDPPAVTPAAVPLPSPEPGPSIAAPPSALAVNPPAAPAAVPLPAPEPAHSTVAHPTPIAVDPPPHSGVPALPGPLATPAAALRVPQTYGSRPAYNYKPPSRNHRPEKDPRGRPGRRRTTDGWVQKLE